MKRRHHYIDDRGELRNPSGEISDPARKKVPVVLEPKPAKRINSRAKGVQGELGVRDLLREYGYEAHRGQQHSGGAGSPDVIHNIPGMHIEVKWVNGGNLYRWLEQAIQDAGPKIPVVFHRMDRREWVVIMRAKDFLQIYAPPPSGEW